MEEFNTIIKDIIENKQVKQMKNYIQHGKTTCFDHCYNASYLCFKIAKKLHLDYKSLARGAMLHDFFLYDWHGKGFNHAKNHSKIALKNANKLFKLNNKEKDIILKHMWPVTLTPPKYIESYILTLVDKYLCIKEVLMPKHINIFNSKFIRYANLFIQIIILKLK